MLVVREGKGIRVYDESGKEYIEAVAGLWSAALGFGGEDRLVEVAARVIAQTALLSPVRRCAGQHTGVVELI